MGETSSTRNSALEAAVLFYIQRNSMFDQYIFKASRRTVIPLYNNFIEELCCGEMFQKLRKGDEYIDVNTQARIIVNSLLNCLTYTDHTSLSGQVRFIQAMAVAQRWDRFARPNREQIEETFHRSEPIPVPSAKGYGARRGY